VRDCRCPTHDPLRKSATSSVTHLSLLACAIPDRQDVIADVLVKTKTPVGSRLPSELNSKIDCELFHVVESAAGSPFAGATYTNNGRPPRAVAGDSGKPGRVCK
jgi:hypothetical protein